MRTRILGLFFCLSLTASVLAENKVSVIPASEKTATPEQLRQAFIDSLVANDGFDKASLTKLFQNLSQNQSILDRISKPSEKLPWYKYRLLFDSDNRISEGLSFWSEHEPLLTRAQEQYQVPAEIIVAILGVETFYGKFTGQFNVLDSLNTLAFYYPPRAEFFKKELREFLLLTREEGISVTDMKGSYAGAMGKAQFIPSSYRNFAVDFDHDGKRDLTGSPSDAIGSVANYFHMHGWQLNEPIVTRAYLNRHGARAISMQNPADLQSAKLNFSLTRLIERGIRPKMKALRQDDRRVALMAFDAEDDMEYWVGFHNFSVITKYNLSPHYAMAVYQLSEQLKARHAGDVR